MDQLFYYSKSADKNAGKGTNEKVVDYDIYDKLNKIKDWRKILSNFYLSEFTYENKIYNSVEHAFQSKKIELADKEKAYWFCKNSGNLISVGDGLTARKNRKLVVLNNDDLEKWNNIKHKVMEEIYLAKFTQIPIAKKVLLLTKNAILLHGTRGIPITRQYDLENVRNKIQNYTQVEMEINMLVV
jgi:predicted NAD-dependent protein-ADP-ribosyltransferase YbiA (DUF1768 family)